MSFVVTAGGTAGHIYPALAVAAELKRLGKQVVFAGSVGGMEEQMAHQAGLTYQPFAAKGFDRQKPWTLLSSSLILAQSTGKARTWLKEINTRAVAAFGGYASVPVGRAALRDNIPLLIQEQNSHMGWTNRHLSKGAAVIALAYQNAAEALDAQAQQRVHLTGNPVRAEFSVLADAKAARHMRSTYRAELDCTPDDLVLLIFGGSQGARHINQALIALAPELMRQPGLKVLHLTGRKEYQTVKDALEASLEASLLHRWKLVDYCEDMPAAFAASDIVLSRAGASSLAELSAAAKPALLVPFPYATADHQTKNAESLVAAGAAVLVPDAKLDDPVFLETLLPLIQDVDVRTRMAEAAEQFKNEDAAARIAKLLIEIAE